MKVNLQTTTKNTRYVDLRLVLLSINSMQTILLTGKPDGSFWFESDRSTEEHLHKLVSISAKDDKWYAFSEEGRLINTERRRVSELELKTNGIWSIEYFNQHMILIAESDNDQSGVYHKYEIIEHKNIRIGRSDANDICYAKPYVSGEHALLLYENNKWHIKDLNSTNGVYVNGKRIYNADLKTGDMIYIMGLRLIIGNDFLLINDLKPLVSVNSISLKKIVVSPYHKVSNDRDIEPVDYFNRLPRRREALNLPEIIIDEPPLSVTNQKIPMLLRYGGALLMGNVVSIISSVVFPILTQKYTEKEKKEYEKKRVEKYTEYLKEKKEEIYKEKAREEIVLNVNYPEINTVLHYAKEQRQLWERRKTDDDFLSFRIGVGQIPILASFDVPKRKFNLDEDQLEKDMFALIEDKVLLDNVPIMTSFSEDFICGVDGQREKALYFVRNIIFQLSLLYSSDEVKMIFLIEPEELSKFEFVKYLPHCWNDQQDIRFLATNVMEAYFLSEYLQNEIDDDIRKEDFKKIIKSNVYYFVFAFSKKIFDSMEVFKHVLMEDRNIGFSILNIYDELPKECTKIFQLSNENKIIYIKDLDRKDDTFELEHCNLKMANQSMKAVANLRLKMLADKYSLPKMITFLQLYNVGTVEALNPLKRWGDNNPVKSLAAAVGVGVDGELFYLDLHEKHHGPHGLVAGMTGSGKSEFIITYILSMAINYHPDEVAFILIDYKGGGLAGAFEDEERDIHLPHIVGTITNLDGAAIQRSLASIESELLRRQALFNEAKHISNEGTLDIYDYQKLYRKGVVTQPLPHLFIISDEFAELKSQQPEFMDKLISTARIGRSLGVHLILATQKPAGVVDEQIWSNTKFRVCLRVQDKMDSMDMLKRPEAAELKDTGRFYMQVGYNEYFAMGQSAWCGAEYETETTDEKDDEFEITFVDTVGHTVLNKKPEKKKSSTGSKQIVTIVRYLSDLAKRLNIEPRKLWKEPLPKKICLQDLVEKFEIEKYGDVHVTMGLVDDPSRQSQYPLILNLQKCQHYLIIGEAGSGKTTFLQTMLYNLVTEYNPEQVNYYILDFNSHTLNVFGKSPHCGLYVTEEQDDQVSAFFEMLQEIVAARKKVFEEAEVSNYEAYIKIQNIPMIFVIVDNLPVMADMRLKGDYYYEFDEYMKKGIGVGVKFIITSNYMDDLSGRVRQQAGHGISLRQKDKFDHTDAIHARCEFAPPDIIGRGMCNYNERALEYQAALCVDIEQEQERIKYLKGKIEAVCEKYMDFKSAQKLPYVNETEEFETFCEDIAFDRFPIGYSLENTKKICIPFQQMYSMSVYFGNQAGVLPIFRNFIYASKHEHMSTYVVKKGSDSIFNDLQEEGNILEGVTLLDCTEETVKYVRDMIVDLTRERKKFRDHYCEKNGLTEQLNKEIEMVKRRREAGTVNEKDATLKIMQKVGPELRRNSEPILFIIEDFIEFSSLVDEVSMALYPVLLTSGKWYNYYFIAGFYPKDYGRVDSDLLYQYYNPDQLCLLFGGRFAEQSLVNLPSDLANIQKEADYNKLLMYYRDEAHPLLMPCGEIMDSYADPDERSIFS